MPTYELSVLLPAGYRPSDILAFYDRDPEGISEIIEEQSIRKGLMWEGQTACLSVHFQEKLAIVRLCGDQETQENTASFEAMARRCLGLDQDGESFERAVEADPVFGKVVAAQRGRRVPVTATPFEALAWAIIGQQISVSAAVSIRRRLLQGLALRHSSGLLCFPTASEIAPLSEEDLVGFGFSRGKAKAIKSVCIGIEQGRLPLDQWLLEMPVEQIRESLLQIKGIGPWTVDYTLLRGFGWLDGSLHGDVAVRRNLAALLGLSEYPSQEFTKQWLEQYRPWRALAAAHLWGCNIQ